jgi:hypothetical protein
MPLPSPFEQSRRWASPYDIQIANDLASEQAGLAQAQQQAQSAQATNAQLARSREAVKAATEFVRRKEVERMVRNGMPLEDAEFQSRVKYNTANAAQLNALRPVPPPAPTTIGGVEGVISGTRGQNWKPLHPQEDAIASREKIAAEGNALKQKLQDERLAAAAKDRLNKGFDLVPHMQLNRYNADIKEALLNRTNEARTNALNSVDAKWKPVIEAARSSGNKLGGNPPPAPAVKDRVKDTIYMTPKGPHKWMGTHWNTVNDNG